MEDKDVLYCEIPNNPVWIEVCFFVRENTVATTKSQKSVHLVWLLPLLLSPCMTLESLLSLSRMRLLCRKNMADKIDLTRKDGSIITVWTVTISNWKETNNQLSEMPLRTHLSELSAQECTITAHRFQYVDFNPYQTERDISELYWLHCVGYCVSCCTE